MGALSKVIKADVALHAAKAVGAAVALVVAVKGLRAALGKRRR